MKLANVNYEANFDFVKFPFCTWVIESQLCFQQVIEELDQQIQGLEGNFILSENDKILDVSKCAELIIDPFHVDANSRKILSKVYAQMKEAAFAEDKYVETIELMSKIATYIHSLEDLIDYPLEIETEVDFLSLLKAFDVKMGIEGLDFIEQILQYVFLSYDILGKKIFFFVNLKNYLPDQMLETFYQTLAYKDVKILLLEGKETSVSINEKVAVFDNDLCEIF